jgi:hypothetical protein
MVRHRSVDAQPFVAIMGASVQRAYFYTSDKGSSNAK